MLPLYEGRMIGQFDFSQKGWVSGKGRTAVWREIPWGGEDHRAAVRRLCCGVRPACAIDCRGISSGFHGHRRSHEPANDDRGGIACRALRKLGTDSSDRSTTFVVCRAKQLRLRLCCPNEVRRTTPQLLRDRGNTADQAEIIRRAERHFSAVNRRGTATWHRGPDAAATRSVRPRAAATSRMS